MTIRPNIFTSFANIIAAQSTRLGGVSKSPYDSMNLGSNTNDDTNDIEKNKEVFSSKIGIDINQIVRAKQSHSDNILLAEEAGYFEDFDSIITNKTNLFIAVSTADCVPILIFDQSNNAISAIHAGWKGTMMCLVKKTLQEMNVQYGTIGNNCYAYIGPCIHQCSFEVENDVSEHFNSQYYVQDINNPKKYFLDIRQHNYDQLLAYGIPFSQIEVSEFNTYERTDLFFSHRKENGLTGRMWTGIMLKQDQII